MFAMIRGVLFKALNTNNSDKLVRIFGAISGEM